MTPTPGDEMAARGTDAAIAKAKFIAQRPEGETGGDPDVPYVQLTAYIAEYGIDMDNQRFDPEWLKVELDAWMERGGLVTIDFRGEPEAECMNLSYDERGVEGTVVALTEKARKAIASGVYAGLGIGISKVEVKHDDSASNGAIIGGRLTQVSLLDHPTIYRDPRPRPVVRREADAAAHDWRSWPVTSFNVDVICVGCGESQQWPMKCYLESIHVPPVELDVPSELSRLVEGAWISDALPCGFLVTARTAERCLESILQHMASCHDG